ncbi:hypothetical protein [Pinisolibacter aquiterrae]|uniref:hypothetical protein n=1 Tax=Pinisolibacter aquiterrae TaxID=2815579 RepID=UPI001C3E27A0|nr:hypothetical protein [Pinisolibacter aquiterrae]MBV5264993.1 hypothetical protein [Pinisolibacter aquiterrae]MCC8235625.1 hypothetical protein [Pinisolibacter aquiterrae]
MTFTKLPLAALILGASLTPALAESGDLSQTPVAAFEQALGNPAAKSAVIEGRQAAPVVTPTAPTDAATRYLDSRNRDQDR